jgi:hypothetical protein
MNTPQLPVDVVGITSSSQAALVKSTSTKRLDAAVAGNYGQVYANQNATGDTRAWYIRLYAKIAAASGDAVRAFATIENVAAATYRGLHASLSFGTTGSVTGLGVAADATVHIPSGGKPGGTVAAVSADINSDGTTDPDTSRLSFIRLSNQGNATGIGHVDDVAAAIDFTGFTIGAGNMIEASTTEANYAYSVRVLLPDGTPAYLMLASAAG